MDIVPLKAQKPGKMVSKTKAPKQIAELSLKLLQAKADPERAKMAQRYFKEEFRCFGLTSSQVRETAEQVYKTIQDDWSIENVIDFCDIMLPNTFHEPKALSILVLEKFSQDFPASLFLKIKSWLAANYCGSWAAVDVLCPTCLGALLLKYPDLVKKIKTWTRSPNRWVRRASIVSFIKLAKKPGYLDAIYQIAGLHFADKDDLIQKANGWLLREAGKADMKRLEKFLLEKGPSIPRTTLRYAIERFEKNKRKGLLETTR